MSARPFLRRGPSGPLATPSAIVQVGFDEVVYDSPLDTVAASVGAMFPRDVALAPLRVVLDGVTPGNVLEIDFRATIARLAQDYQTDFALDTVAVVTFDGSTPVVPSAATSYVENTSAGANQLALAGAFAQKFTLSGLGNAIIPALATKATVQIFYIGSSFSVGDIVSRLAATLKVTEYTEAVVVQDGPGTIIAT